MRASIGAMALIAAIPGLAAAQQRWDVPPALVWDSRKGNCPASLDWASLRGKVVALSFDADDVFPEQVAEWNEVPHRFQDEPVQFIRVMGGSEFLLDQALKKTPYLGCVLWDRDSANASNFSLPTGSGAVVVDQLGVIAGYTPDEPSAEDVRALLKNEPAPGLSGARPQPQSYNPSAGPDPAPSYAVHISPADKYERRVLGPAHADSYIATNQPLKLIILDLWEMPLARISFPAMLDEGSYDVAVHIPAEDRNALATLVREAIERHFKLSVQKEKRIERVYVLTAARSASSEMRPAQSGEQRMSGGGEGSIVGTAQNLQEIAEAFEGLLGSPVVEETGLSGRFDYSASTSLSGTEGAFDLAHQLGLDLAQSERPIEILVVRQVE